MRLAWGLVIIACCGCRPSAAGLDERTFACATDGDCLAPLRCDLGTCVTFDPAAFGQLSVGPLTGPVGTAVSVSGPAVARATTFAIADVPAVVIRRDGDTARLLVMPGTRSGPVRVVTPLGTFSSTEVFEHQAERAPSLALRETLPTPNDTVGGNPGGGYGRSVAVDAIGETIIAGRPNDASYDGGAWVWVRDGGGWAQQGPKLGGERRSLVPYAGSDVALSAAGDVAVLGGGAYRASQGSVMFERGDDAVWRRASPLLTGQPNALTREGSSVSLTADGQMMLHGSTDGASLRSPRAWIFTRDPDAPWRTPPVALQVNLAGSGYYSFSTALSMDGNTALISASTNDDGISRGWVFSKADGGWSLGVTLDDSDVNGFAVSDVFRVGGDLSGDGRVAVLAGLRLLDSVSNPGVALWAYARGDDGAWRRRGPRINVPGQLRFVNGTPAVSVSTEGDWLLVGGVRPADSLGVLIEYAWDEQLDGGSWAMVDVPLVLPRPVVAVDISFDGTTAVVGTGGSVLLLAPP